MFEQDSWHSFPLLKIGSSRAFFPQAFSGGVFCQRLTLFPFPSLQKGKDEYKLAATSEDGGKKDKKAKAKKDMDDLKKEVDLVSTECLSKASL